MSGLVKGKEVHFDEEYLHVKLEDDRIISTPMQWYKPLKKATFEQLKDYKFICSNTGIEWGSIDYHLSIASMLENSASKVA